MIENLSPNRDIASAPQPVAAPSRETNSHVSPMDVDRITGQPSGASTSAQAPALRSPNLASGRRRRDDRLATPFEVARFGSGMVSAPAIRNAAREGGELPETVARQVVGEAETIAAAVHRYLSEGAHRDVDLEAPLLSPQEHELQRNVWASWRRITHLTRGLSPALRRELVEFCVTAASLSFVQLNLNLTGVVDAGLAGRAGARELAAVGLGASIFLSMALIVQGLAFGVEPFVAQAQGAGRHRAAYQWLAHGMVVNVVASIPLWALTHAGARWLETFGVPPELAAATRSNMMGLLPSLPLRAIASVLQVYLQASNESSAIAASSLVMNAVNFAACYVLLFGGESLTSLGLPALPIPPLGTFGLGLGRTLSMLTQTLMMGYVTVRSLRAHNNSWGVGIDARRLVEVCRVGVPVGLQLFAEVAMFSVVGVLMGAMGETAMAAHQATMMLASMTFGVCVGIGDATAVQTGHAVGRGDLIAARRTGRMGLSLSVGVMTAASAAMLTFPRSLTRLFTDNEATLDVATRLLGAAAFFQLADGIQAVCAGALRGVGDTRTAFLANVGAHWLVGMPAGYLLSGLGDLGPVGLWWGLVAGLTATASVLMFQVLRLRTEDFRPLEANAGLAGQEGLQDASV